MWVVLIKRDIVLCGGPHDKSHILLEGVLIMRAILLVGVLVVRAMLLGVCIRAPNPWKLPTMSNALNRA